MNQPDLFRNPLENPKPGDVVSYRDTHGRTIYLRVHSLFYTKRRSDLGQRVKLQRYCIHMLRQDLKPQAWSRDEWPYHMQRLQAEVVPGGVPLEEMEQ